MGVLMQNETVCLGIGRQFLKTKGLLGVAGGIFLLLFAMIFRYS